MRKIRVLVVDDSVVIRKLLRTVIDAREEMEVVAAAANGAIALKKLDQTPPDVITMDLDMPEMDGLETVRAIRAMGLKIPVIMVSSATHRGAEKTLDSLTAGADDFIAKPANLTDFSQSIQILTVDLVPKIRALAPIEPPVHRQTSEFAPFEGVVRPSLKKGVSALLVASSTGGPAALDQLFGQLGGKTLGVPILVVQHMPPHFTKNLADRLDQTHPLQFKEGASGDRVLADQVYIAPGGSHMEVSRREDGVYLKTHEGPMENFCRPSADVLFRSAVTVYGGELLAVVLTGMGRDGCSGAAMVVSAGGQVLVQDEASSVVWGMPGAIVQAGYAHAVMSIPELASGIRNRLKR